MRDRAIKPFAQVRLRANGLQDERLARLGEVVLRKPKCNCDMGRQTVRNPLVSASDA
jgi:hypothetical protein